MLVEFTPSEARWQVALAKVESLAVNRVTFSRRMDAHEDEAVASWLYVASATAEGETYIVIVNEFAGDIASSCTCRAGQFGRACWHQAAAIQRMGPMPNPAPLAIDVAREPFADRHWPEAAG